MPDERNHRHQRPAPDDEPDDDADGLVDSDATTQADLGMSGEEAPAGTAAHSDAADPSARPDDRDRENGDDHASEPPSDP